MAVSVFIHDLAHAAT